MDGHLTIPAAAALGATALPTEAQLDTLRKGPNRRQLAKAATRARLIAAARELFTEVGYFDTGIRDIAAAMNMSTGAVFNQVEDKAALWRLAMGGPAPSEALAQEVALIMAQRPGWSWLLRFNGEEYLAALVPPAYLPDLLASGARGDSPAAALHMARLVAERRGAAAAAPQ